MRQIFAIILFLMTLEYVHATPQVPDFLIYEGDTIPIFSNPLEAYLERNGLKDIDRGCNSSSCRRGYIATWRISNNKLYLIKIKPCGIIASAGVITGLECDSIKSSAVLNYFNKTLGAKEVFADWYSDSIIAPKGRLIEYIHMNYLSKYERELHFYFKNGNLAGKQMITNTIKPELYDQYNYSLIQDTIFHYIAKLDWKYLSEKLFCDDTYLITINKRGRVSKVKLEPLGDSKWKDFWFNFNDDGCKLKLKKSIKKLKFKDYLKGKSHKIVVKLSLRYNDGEIRMMN